MNIRLKRNKKMAKNLMAKNIDQYNDYIHIIIRMINITKTSMIIQNIKKI